RGDEKKGEAVDQVMEVVRSLSQDYENVWGSMVKQTLGRINPGFNHEYHGYRTFNGLLKDLEKRKLVELSLDRDRGNYRIILAEEGARRRDPRGGPNGPARRFSADGAVGSAHHGELVRRHARGARRGETRMARAPPRERATPRAPVRPRRRPPHGRL